MSCVACQQGGLKAQPLARQCKGKKSSGWRCLKHARGREAEAHEWNCLVAALCRNWPTHLEFFFNTHYDKLGWVGFQEVGCCYEHIIKVGLLRAQAWPGLDTGGIEGDGRV